MTRTKNTIAVSFAALLIGGLMINPASAAAKRSDVSSVTHSAVSATPNQEFGHSDKFNRADISSVTHSSVGAGTKSIGKTSSGSYNRNDLNAVTHK